jgi:hypothetical protein
MQGVPAKTFTPYISFIYGHKVLRFDTNTLQLLSKEALPLKIHFLNRYIIK